MLVAMSEVTRILSAIEEGDPSAAEQLLPLVYDELRRLAAQRLANEKPGQTLDATGLVHEAYLRLMDNPLLATDRQPPTSSHQERWNGRGHFFAAAAEAMRRILVENARRKHRQRHGGGRRRVALGDVPAVQRSADDVLIVDDAVAKLATEDPDAASLVKLHFYAGFSIEEAADALLISRAQAYRQWNYARAWLRCALEDQAAS